MCAICGRRQPEQSLKYHEKPSSVFCTCGLAAVIRPGARLCSNCGLKPATQPQALSCVHCGAQLFSQHTVICHCCGKTQSQSQVSLEHQILHSSENQCVDTGEQLANQDKAESAKVQTWPTATPQSQRCVCGTVFRPDARVCTNPNCGKPRPRQPQGPPCVHCGMQLITQNAKICHNCYKSQLTKSPDQSKDEKQLTNQEKVEHSQKQTQLSATYEIQAPPRCVCGTVFYPSARLCANCGKLRPKQPQGPPCVHCGEKLMHQNAKVCHHCGRNQVPAPSVDQPQGPPCVHCGVKLPKQDSTRCVHCYKKQPKKQSSSEVQKNSATKNDFSMCACGCIFHPDARACANCGKPAPRKRPQNPRETEANLDETLNQGHGLVVKMNQLSCDLQQELQRFQKKVDIAETRAKDVAAQLCESQVCIYNLYNNKADIIIISLL